jgi:hypothetical protein
MLLVVKVVIRLHLLCECFVKNAVLGKTASFMHRRNLEEDFYRKSYQTLGCLPIPIESFI